jgi:Leucine-rich repeat (LRR) protein
MRIKYSIFIIFTLFGCSEPQNPNNERLKDEPSKQFDPSDFALNDFKKRLNLASGDSFIDIGPIQIENLPDEFYNEIQAKTIKMDCIVFPCIVELSPKISQLNKLKELHIVKSSLTTLPSEIESLSELKILTIAGGGKLNSIPESIGELQNLEKLDFWRNNLSTLPTSIAKLKKLESLNLIENNFSLEEREKIQKLLPKCDVKFEY